MGRLAVQKKKKPQGGKEKKKELVKLLSTGKGQKDERKF